MNSICSKASSCNDGTGRLFGAQHRRVLTGALLVAGFGNLVTQTANGGSLDMAKQFHGEQATYIGEEKDRKKSKVVSVLNHLDVNRMLEQAPCKFASESQHLGPVRKTADNGDLVLISLELSQEYLTRFSKDSTSLTKVQNLIKRYNIQSIEELKDIFERKFNHIKYVLVPVSSAYRKMECQLMLRTVFLDSPDVQEVLGLRPGIENRSEQSGYRSVAPGAPDNLSSEKRNVATDVKMRRSIDTVSSINSISSIEPVSSIVSSRHIVDPDAIMHIMERTQLIGGDELKDDGVFDFTYY